MTRPVAEILEQARREGWPTSYIDAMANQHLCGNLARDYVNDCFVDQRHGPRGDGQAEARQDAGPHTADSEDSRPPSMSDRRGPLLARPTLEELAKLRDATAWPLDHRQDASGTAEPSEDE